MILTVAPRVGNLELVHAVLEADQVRVHGVGIVVVPAGDWCFSRPALVRQRPRRLAGIVVRLDLDLDGHPRAGRGSRRRGSGSWALGRVLGLVRSEEGGCEPSVGRPVVDALLHSVRLDLGTDVEGSEVRVAGENTRCDASNVCRR